MDNVPGGGSISRGGSLPNPINLPSTANLPGGRSSMSSQVQKALAIDVNNTVYMQISSLSTLL